MTQISSLAPRAHAGRPLLGTLVWSRRLAGVGPGAVAATSQHVLLTGGLTGTEDFGGTPLVSAGKSDAFVAKIVNP